MAEVIDPGRNLVKLDDGSVVTAQTGGWYNGQQYWGGSLGAPGQFNAQNNQPGQQGAAYVAPENQAYIQQQQATYQAPAPQSNPGGVPAPTAQTGGGGGVGYSFNQPSIDLNSIYQNLTQSSGISDVEKQITDKTLAYNQAVASVKDNPYLSEATMSGRLSKLEDKYKADLAALNNQVATKKADVETQLNLQTKQFDINSQQAQTAFNQFTSLLSAGALDNASANDIAGITQATGLSSDMIYSAINTNKKKNQQTQIIQFDDGTNQGYSIIDPTTGEIIKTQTIASSKPSSSGGGTVSERQLADEQQTTQNLIGDIQRGATLRDVVGHYGVAGGLSVEDIYRIYNTYSPYGAAKEDIEDVKLGKFNA